MNAQRDSAGETSPINVFVPFGGGQRRCPGYELARVGLSVFLHHMVTRFRYVKKKNLWVLFFFFGSCFAVCVCAYTVNRVCFS